MKTKYHLPFLPLLILPILAGCGTGGDWPNLSDKLPDPADRNRVIERANPAPAPRTEDPAPITEAEAEALMAEILAEATAREAAYREALTQFTHYQPADDKPDDSTHLWLEAQLALTRFSHTVSRLNSILDSRLTAQNPVWQRADAAKKRLDTIIVAERRALDTLTPRQGR